MHVWNSVLEERTELIGCYGEGGDVSVQGAVVLTQVEGAHLRFLREGCKMVSGQSQVT